MNRRGFLGALGAVAAAVTLPAWAQSAERRGEKVVIHTQWDPAVSTLEKTKESQLRLFLREGRIVPGTLHRMYWHNPVSGLNECRAWCRLEPHELA